MSARKKLTACPKCGSSGFYYYTKVHMEGMFGYPAESTGLTFTPKQVACWGCGHSINRARAEGREEEAKR